MQKRYKTIGLLGGTFDPVHSGHLQIAKHVLDTLNLEEVRFIPCYQPVHRDTPTASPIQRLEMLALATESEPRFIVDEQEIKRQGPSYMIDTLKSLKQEFPNYALCLILGTDSFVLLDTWHEWKSLMDYAHIIVVNRMNDEIHFSENILNLLGKYETKEPEELNQFLNGKIYQLAIPTIDISSTEIRKQLSANKIPEDLLPDNVTNYIKSNTIY